MRTLVIALLACAFALAADSPYVGTWTMNKAKSTPDPNMPTLDTLTVQFRQDGPALKAIATTNGNANPEVVIDGKEQPMKTAGPNPLGATHYVATADGKTTTTVFKKDGKTVATRKSSLSPDGKTMTSVMGGTLPDGKKISSTLVFDKQ
jgi:hypothetical protein